MKDMDDDYVYDCKQCHDFGMTYLGWVEHIYLVHNKKLTKVKTLAELEEQEDGE